MLKSVCAFLQHFMSSLVACDRCSDLSAAAIEYKSESKTYNMRKVSAGLI